MLILLLFKHHLRYARRHLFRALKKIQVASQISKEVTNACSQATNDELKVANCKLELLKAVEQQGLVEKT